METKTEKFIRMWDVRFPKALKAVELLANLAGRDYDPLMSTVKPAIEQLYTQLNQIEDVFGLSGAPEAPTAAPEAPVRPSEAPVSGLDTPDYGGSEWQDVSWALDSLITGDHKKARELLVRALAK